MQITDPRTGLDVTIRNGEEYWREIMAEKTCAHVGSELRRWVNRGGGTAACSQCTVCGVRVGNPAGGVAHAGLPPADEQIAPAWEQRSRERCEAIQIAYIDRQQAEDGNWQAEYEAYRRTDAWQERRALILKRCGGVCEGCGTAPATEVHHTTYDHVMEEFLFELQGLCGPCHARWHATTR